MIKYFDPNNLNEELVKEGDLLISHSGSSYPIINGIPRFVNYNDSGQKQTSGSFAFKWNKNSDWGIEEKTKEATRKHWKNMYGTQVFHELKQIMGGKIVLDAGCGSGSSLPQFIDWPMHIVGADISQAIDSCKHNFSTINKLQLVQADINYLPFEKNVFDVIWSAGVLHHTPNTFNSLAELTKHLKVGGIMIFYVYIKKAPIREFTDDYLRQEMSGMSYDEAWDSMVKLTNFSKALFESNASITLDEDYPELGFKRGKHKLQRFIYYTMMKCYWNPNINFEQNVTVNFDWYHPRYAHRHTIDEVKSWLAKLHIKEKNTHISESGIFVIGEKLKDYIQKA